APRGEVTVVVAPTGATEDPDVVMERARALATERLRTGARPSAVAREVAERHGLARNLAYRIVHDLEDSVTSE
ncbi:MAG: hypothetical protein ACPHQP_09790, partial [Longimicrobiales bacterium]